MARELKPTSVRSLAICFLNSFANPAHERIVATDSRAFPDLFITLSSDVAPRSASFRAPDRPSTPTPCRSRSPTCGAERAAGARGLSELAADHAVLRRGGRRRNRRPHPGAHDRERTGGRRAGRLSLRGAWPRPAMSFDMGGTTAKACPIEDGARSIAGLFEVDRRWRFKEGSGLPIASRRRHDRDRRGRRQLARPDELGLLKVGPRQRRSRSCRSREWRPECRCPP